MVPLDVPAAAPYPSTRGGEVAVIDVGSNSVRLVVYDGLYRAPIPLYEDKVMCGLGRGLGNTGLLSPEGKAEAYETLSRFTAITRLRGIGRTFTVATAALRDAQDGPAFRALLEKDLGLEIRVLQGEEEAELAALGVAAAMKDATGLVADIGGGSLDLALLDRGRIQCTASLRLGPYHLMPLGDRATDRAVVGHIDQTLTAVPWLSQAQGQPLYAVGGAWRTIGAIHLDQSHYALNVLNGYGLSGQDMRELAAELARRQPSILRKMRGVGSSRAITLPFSAMALSRLIDIFQVESVMISSQGLREGVLYQRLAAEDRLRNPVLDFTARLAVRNGAKQRAEVLWRFLRPVRDSLPHAIRDTLARAALDLSDHAMLDHPSYQAQHAYDRVLRLPTAALGHHDRAILGLIVFHRYGGDSKMSRTPLVKELLNDEERASARQYGGWVGFCHALTAGRPEILAESSIEIAGDTVILALHPSLAPLMSRRRLAEVNKLAARQGQTMRVMHSDLEEGLRLQRL